MATATETIVPEGRVRSMMRLYATLGRVSIMEQFQYRAANYFYMIGMVTEPVIYLVVWSTIAREQGGSVGDAARRAEAASGEYGPRAAISA